MTVSSPPLARQACVPYSWEMQMRIGIDADALIAALHENTQAMWALGVRLKATNRELHTMSDSLNAEILAEGDAIAKLTDVVGSAKALIEGFAARLEAAIADAATKGATPTQLATLRDMNAAIVTTADSLAASVAANTPAEPPPPPADTVTGGTGNDTVTGAPA